MIRLPFADNPLKTRADVQRLATDLVEPLIGHFSPGRAEVRLSANRASYGDPGGWLEGFARPLWGLAPLAVGGGHFKHWALWQEGLAAGTDPAHAEYWGLTGDFDQRSVEQAALGFALALAPELVWEPLGEQARANLMAWLTRINEVKLVRNNWLFFRVLVNVGLGRVRGTGSREKVAADLEAIDEFYLGDGWYSDGPPGPPHRDGRLGDYYVPMALHFYGLIYARLCGAEEPTRASVHVERARVFARDFVHWFSRDGAALPFGRSLTYRFAQGAFWGALAFANVEALPWGVVKGLYLRHLRWWLKQPVFSETGLLTVGYAYPNQLMAESYNSPGSPYWALKALLPLALSEEHPFWSAEEAPLPRRPAVHTVPLANLVLITDPSSHDVTALNPGQPVLDWPRNAAHKYSKCVYSTRFGFSVPTSMPTLSEGGLDNGLSVSEDGRLFRVREHCLDAEVRDGVAYSRWQPGPDIEVRTWLIAAETAHVRVHQLRTARKLWAVEAGFAPGFTDWRSVRLLADGASGPLVRTLRGASLLGNLFGQRQAECVALGANSPLLTSLGAMPVLHSIHEPGVHWLACVVSGSADPEESFASISGFAVEMDASGCRVLVDGELHWSFDDSTACGRSEECRLQALRRPIE